MESQNLDGNFNFATNIKEFKSSVTDLKEKMNKLLRMCDSTDFKQNEAFDTLQEGLANLMEIKYLNSEVQKELEIFKEQTLKEREKAEEKNLNFQNYLYQKENIISQINYCSNYPTEEMDKIKFSEQDEIIQYYQSKGMPLDDLKLDTMDSLKYELELRKALDEKVKTLTKDKELNETKLKEKEKYFRDLPSYLKDLELSTLKAQNYLNLNITSKYSDSVLSEKLPQPLFVLYNSLMCVNKSNLQYELKIMGIEDDIAEFYEKYPMDNINFDLNADSPPDNKSKIKSSRMNHTENKEEGEHTDSGEINESDVNPYERENSLDRSKFKDDRIKDKFLERKSKRRKIENKDKNHIDNRYFKTLTEKSDGLDIINLQKIKKFPLYLHFEIKSFTCSLYDNSLITYANKNILPICINFYYLPIFNIVTAEVISNNKNSAFNLTTNQIMSNIFIPPANLLSSFKTEINQAISFLCDESSNNEKFFNYIQILANNVNYNLTYLKKICEIVKNKNLKNKTHIQESIESKDAYFDSPMKITADNFISLIVERITFLPALLNQVDFLLKNKKILPEAMNEIQREKRYNLIKEKTIISDVSRISQNEFLKIFEESFDNDFSEENFKLISVFEKDDEGNYFKKFLKVPITFYTEEEAIYLCITFERKSARMYAFVEIGMDYPHSNPKFILKIITDKSKAIQDIHKNLISENNDLLVEMNITNSNEHRDTKLYTRIIRDVERELNEYSHEYCPVDARPYLLSYQIRNAIMCFDIFYDIQNNKLNSSYISNSKGNKKRLPFRFNESKNIFEGR